MSLAPDTLKVTLSSAESLLLFTVPCGGVVEPVAASSVQATTVNPTRELNGSRINVTCLMSVKVIGIADVTGLRVPLGRPCKQQLTSALFSY
jgi:hypothetical protein